jgi:phospholipid/cholesterol/gamma-HCH transport system substrate-binding protein
VQNWLTKTEKLMAKRKTNTIKLGIFIFIGMLLLVLSIFLIGDKNAIFSSRFQIKAYFNDIQGLRNGATVRLSGIDVGSVRSVEFTGDTGKVMVTMDLLEEIRRFIKTDTKASIETEGLVGNKVVVLEIGTSGDPIRDGGTIQSKEPVGFAQIIEETQGIMGYTKEMTRDLAEIISRVNRGEGTIGKILVDEELYNQATQLTSRADKSLEAITEEVNRLTILFTDLSSGIERVVTNVDSAITDVNYILTGIQEGKGVMGALLADGSRYDSLVTSTMDNIQKTAADARLAASRLAENMEALKHNWLFKSYFENRGYWDAAAHEDQIDTKLNQLDSKIQQLDKKIETLKTLEKSTSGVGSP